MLHHTSRPCKRDIYAECAHLLHQVISEEDMMRTVTLLDPYVEHFDGRMILVCSVITELMSQPPIKPKILWYLDGHPERDEKSDSAAGGLLDLSSAPPASSCTAVIE